MGLDVPELGNKTETIWHTGSGFRIPVPVPGRACGEAADGAEVVVAPGDTLLDSFSVSTVVVTSTASW